MDFTKAEASVMYGLTVPTDLALRLGISKTLNGRNVGQATTITAGAFHTFHF
jgi:oxalate decarboxylase/phosphoglucose isomerase-like protein (cupin superfamily)